MEVTPPPSMLVDPAIDPREGAIGASLHKAEQLTSSELGLAAPVLGEHVNIHALDVVGALLILIAEVREALTLVANSPGATVNSAPIQPMPGDSVAAGLTPWTSSIAEAAVMNAEVGVMYTALGVPQAQPGPATVPLTVIQMMLHRLPAEESQLPAEWLNTATRVEEAVRMALDKAVDTVMAWRDVPPTAVAAVSDARTAVLAALEEDSPNLLWLLPEMISLLPRMQRYWRLRRRLRRSLDQDETMQGGNRRRQGTPLP